MIKTVVFDLGKVLLDFDYAIAARKIAARGKIRTSVLKLFIDHAPLVLRYETGLLTSEEFYQEIAAATGFGGDIKEFGDCFSDIFTPIEAMIELNAALRKHGMPTFIFSNTNEFVVEFIRRRYPFFANFDGYILSYEHRAMKPDARLYEVVERETARRGAEILYLDDRPENVAAGTERGWQALLHETPEKSHAAVEKLGLLA